MIQTLQNRIIARQEEEGSERGETSMLKLDLSHE